MIFLTSCAILKKEITPQPDLTKYSVEDQIDSAKAIITGYVYDEGKNSKEPLIFSSVTVYEKDKLLTGMETDFDGYFEFALDPGFYDIEFSYVGHTTYRIENIELPSGKAIHLIQGLKQNRQIFFGCRGYEIPLIQLDNTTSGKTFTSDQIRLFPSRP